MTKINWAGVREARAKLTAIAREHPELLTPPSEENRRGWERDLEEIMARPAAFGETTQVAFRLPPELIERLDQHVERMKRATLGLNVSRADAVRHLLLTGLDQAERAETEATKPKKR